MPDAEFDCVALTVEGAMRKMTGRDGVRDEEIPKEFAKSRRMSHARQGSEPLAASGASRGASREQADAPTSRSEVTRLTGLEPATPDIEGQIPNLQPNLAQWLPAGAMPGCYAIERRLQRRRPVTLSRTSPQTSRHSGSQEFTRAAGRAGLENVGATMAGAP